MIFKKGCQKIAAFKLKNIQLGKSLPNDFYSFLI